MRSRKEETIIMENTTTTTAAQTFANRENAAFSTGPNTEQGKARSAQNAITHGATSRRLLFGQETQARFDSFRESVFQHHQPCDEYEILLTDKVAITAWRHHRLLRIESEAYSRITGGMPGQESDSDAAILADHFLNEEDEEMGRFMRTIPRYVTGAAREWKQAMSALESIQKERKAREAAQPPAEPAAVPLAAATSATAALPALPANLTRSERRAIQRTQRKAARRSPQTEIGFVSQAA